MKFNYQARTKTGEIQTGVVEASSKEAAANLLRTYNLYITILEEASLPFYARRMKLFERISKKEIVAFSRQLAIMFKSEIPVVEMLQTLAKQTQNPNLKEKILDMVEKIEGGTSLSKTFAFYPEIFTPFYVSIVRSGEISGKLSEIFSYLADYLEKEHHFYGKIRGAMTYPLFVLLVFLVILVAMIFFVIPQLTQVLTQAGGELPVLTKFLIGATAFLRKWFWLLILIFLFLIIFIFYYSRSKECKIFFDKNLLRVPLLGGFLKKIYLARLALNLSTLISGGLPIVQALETTAEVLGNETYKSIILETSEGVKRGEQISVFLQRYPKEITPLFVQMVIVGEKTGKLESALTNVVDFYQKEVDRTLDSLIGLLEPILIIVFGVLVGGLILSVILPLYKVVSGF
jgi:type IV pilus assembly protein PilC